MGILDVVGCRWMYQRGADKVENDFRIVSSQLIITMIMHILSNRMYIMM